MKKILITSSIIILIIGASLVTLFYFRTPLMMYFYGEKKFPVLVVSGTWKEMGYQIGSNKKFAQGIHRLASFLKRPFPPEKAKDYFNKAKKFMSASIIEQMQGLAEGESKAMGISYKEAWDDVLIWNFFIPSTYINGCTAFAVTTGNSSFIAHNTDLEYLYSLGGTLIIFKPNEGLGYPFFSFFQPGFVGTSLGENLNGLAFVFNAAYPSGRDFGIPPEIFLRKVIQESGSLEEAIAQFQNFIKNGGRFAHNGSILTFMDFKEKKMARVEVAPDRIEVTYGTTDGDKTYTLATNHYLSMPERNKRKDFNTSSYARYERCEMLIRMTKIFNVENIFKILTDHDGKEMGTDYTICRHKNLNIGTNNSIIIDDKFTFYYIIGNPCRYLKDSSLLQTVRWKEML